MPTPMPKPTWLPVKPRPRTPYWPKKRNPSKLTPLAAQIVAGLPSVSRSTGIYTPRPAHLPRLQGESKL